MLKFKIDTSDLDFSDVVEGLNNGIKAAQAEMVNLIDAEGRRLASQKLKSDRAKNHWNRGFRVAKYDDNTIIMSIDGLLANWMESGIDVGEISDKIMSGQRAEFNVGAAQKGKAFGEATGKKYVDVPIGKDANALGNIHSGRGGRGAINIRAFQNAAQVTKHITSSDYKSGQIKQKQVVQSRIKDVIKNIEPTTGQASYLVIRRVTEDSVWPKQPFPGAQVFTDLEDFVFDNIDHILERYI